jgi:hypothetical protein
MKGAAIRNRAYMDVFTACPDNLYPIRRRIYANPNTYTTQAG